MTSRVDDVERLLQVVSVLRAADGRPVARERLVRQVPAYAAAVSEESLKKMTERDLEALRGLGFRIANVAAAGSEAEFILAAGSWRLPVELDPLDQGLLVWVMAAAGAEAQTPSVLTSVPDDLSSLLGAVPRSLDLAQTAIASRRTLLLIRDGEEVVFSPGLLAARHGRWFLLGRYGDSPTVKAPRLDRLEVLGLGDPITDPVVITDADAHLDPTAWEYHEERHAVLRCRTADLGSVASWFPRAVINAVDAELSELTFSYRNEEALVSRVVGLAGAVWVLAPASGRAAVRTQALAVMPS